MIILATGWGQLARNGHHAVTTRDCRGASGRPNGLGAGKYLAHDGIDRIGRGQKPRRNLESAMERHFFGLKIGRIIRSRSFSITSRDDSYPSRDSAIRIRPTNPHAAREQVPVVAGFSQRGPTSRTASGLATHDRLLPQAANRCPLRPECQPTCHLVRST